MSPSGDLEGLPPLGSVLAGKYELVRVLGRGGMGVVVQARHLRMERDVALKILLPALRDQPEVVARFAREGRAAAQLQDVHVTRVLDVDSLPDGCPFIVMELLRGEDLAEILHRRGKLAYRDAVGYLVEACAGMAEAHRVGIVHRDLKPNNLFVDKQGERPVLKVLDFGISKVTGDVAASVTATATAFGTPLYMSPEQVRSAKSVDARADIWSLGVVLYELLAGESPFAAESATAILAAIIADAPVPIAERRPDLPPPLADAIMRTLDKDPAGRFPDVVSFAAALAPYGPDGDAAPLGSSLAPPLTGPVVAPAATQAPPQKARAAARPASVPIAPIAAGVLLAIVASGFLFLAVGRRGHAAPAPTAQAEPSARAALVAPPPVVAPVATVEPAPVETATASPLPMKTAVEATQAPRASAALPHVAPALPRAVPPDKPAAKPAAPPPPVGDPHYL